LNVCFRQACLTSHFVSVTSDTYSQPMYSLWTAVATTMFQRLKALKTLLGLYLNRRQAKALLEQVQASDLNDEARDRISQILRFMLRLPKDS
jgi:ABC-type transport system involved in cytochrome c biogenesis permease subunit